MKNQLHNIGELSTGRINLIFIFLLIGLFFFLGFSGEFFLGPKGIHFIRQVDSLSFVYGFENNGFNFFEPELFDLNSTNGKAACEFPILYYLVALSFKLFGQKMFLLKLVNVLITYVGVFYLFRLLQDILKDTLYAILITLLLFTSTVFNYYSFNYLPDTAALGFSFIGWFFINRFRMFGENKSVIFSFLFFSLSGLIKVTYLINPIAILCVVLYFSIFRKNHNSEKQKNKKVLIYGALSIASVLLWNWYIIVYNSANHSTLFNTKPLPIWALNKSEIGIVWLYISKYWHSVYFAPSTFHLLWAMVLIQIVRIRNTNKVFNLLIVFSTLGFVAYLLLFYIQFKDHDYYALIAAPLIIFLFVNGVLGIKSFTKNQTIHVAVKLILITIVLVGINYSRMKLKERFEVKISDVSRASAIIQSNLKDIEALEIPKDSKVIIAPEESKNGSLLFLNRKGWSIFYKDQIDLVKITQYKGLGAEYLFLMVEDIELREIANLAGEKILQRENMIVYKL